MASKYFCILSVYAWLGLRHVSKRKLKDSSLLTYLDLNLSGAILRNGPPPVSGDGYSTLFSFYLYLSFSSVLISCPQSSSSPSSFCAVSSQLVPVAASWCAAITAAWFQIEKPPPPPRRLFQQLFPSLPPFPLPDPSLN